MFYQSLTQVLNHQASASCPYVILKAISIQR
uniref:Uncharacterized protein n=1 Tax=Arundo donax TaxID=35708 RepID=A0A0A9H3D9_ARUDO